MRPSNPLRAIPALLLPALSALAFLCGAGGVARADSCRTLFPEQPTRVTLSSGLPDCRAYEQVNPVFKGGGNVAPFALSEDGSAFVYATFAAAPDSNGHNPSGGVRQVFYEARRTPSGWRSFSIMPSSTQYYPGISVGLPGGPSDVSPHLDRFLYALTDNPYREFGGGTTGLYVTTPSGLDGCSTPDGGACVVNATPNLSVSDGYFGGSSDFSHLVLFASDLVPGDPTKPPSVGSEVPKDITESYDAGTAASPEYRYRLIGLDNSGGPTSLVSDCTTELGSGSNLELRNSGNSSVYHAVSADGSKIFFTALQGCSLFDPHTFEVTHYEGPTVNEVAVRVDGSHTIPISEPSLSFCTLPTPDPSCADAVFEGASADGTRAFFTTTQPETGGTDTTKNLYEAKVGESSLNGMTQVSAGAGAEGAQVQGVVRISDDGSHVYFVAQGVLTSAPDSHGRTAQAGADHLYAYDGASGETKFVAALSSSDSSLWGNDDRRQAQASADGRFLVFDSVAQLTPDDTDTSQDVYRYDFQSGELVRVSAGRGGYDADGNGAFDAEITAPAFDSGGAFAGVNQVVDGTVEAKRALNSDGSTVFFSTSEPLQSTDVNSAPDVYEWDEGQVSLLSDGHNRDTASPKAATPGEATTFVGASADGSDAFFQTNQVLDPAGGDGAYDVFDARIGGGFAQLASSVPCSGDSCQGAPSNAPATTAPTSSTYQGTGNLSPSGQPKPPAPPSAAQLRANKLKATLKLCHKLKSKAKRKSCEKTARIQTRAASRRRPMWRP
jgi:hypothetical protein